MNYDSIAIPMSLKCLKLLWVVSFSKKNRAFLRNNACDGCDNIDARGLVFFGYVDGRVRSGQSPGPRYENFFAATRERWRISTARRVS